MWDSLKEAYLWWRAIASKREPRQALLYMNRLESFQALKSFQLAYKAALLIRLKLPEEARVVLRHVLDRSGAYRPSTEIDYTLKFCQALTLRLDGNIIAAQNLELEAQSIDCKRSIKGILPTI